MGKEKTRWHKVKRRLWKFTKYGALSVIVLVLISRFILPKPEFDKPTSTVVLDKDGALLGARIAEDGQWRFPKTTDVPQKFEKCILTFEDQQFRRHFGVNPASIVRALIVNFKAGKIKQGGSTLTMQLARLHQDGQPRTVWQKAKELVLAFHFEINYSKDELLELYVSHAPFGGNVVGLDAAAWRYYGRPADHLTWSECAALAVLPNAPSLIFPGKNEQRLKGKRNRLLNMLKEEALLPEEEYKLALIEALPLKPKSLPNKALHLTDRANSELKGKLVNTTIHADYQRTSQLLVNQFIDGYKHNEIYNAAAVIIDTKTGEILSYVGNATNSRDHANAVDIVSARRSTGSLLKPFLFASMASKGELLPSQLLTDIPTFIAGYKPENYHKTFDGVVPANEALFRSLNVPWVRQLRSHGVSRFYNELKLMRMNSLDFNSGHYGLALILGGAEGELLNLTSMYAGLGRILTSYDGTSASGNQHFYNGYWQGSTPKPSGDAPELNPAAVYETLNALTEAKRPAGEQGWKYFGSTNKVAWKTGTSFGNRDAWAIGTTPEYTIGVWVGNADGEGRAGLTGVGYAAPLLFELFEKLPETTWFDQPFDSYREVELCVESGHVASAYCNATQTQNIPLVESHVQLCPYHKLIHLSEDGTEQVTSKCAEPHKMMHSSWFVLTPAQEWYFKLKSPTYKRLPPFKDGCRAESEKVMEFIYPKFPNKVYLPVYMSGEEGKAVFKLAHRNPEKEVFWHLDGTYIGSTRDFHSKEISTSTGQHVILLSDEDGNEASKYFEVLNP
ncbi:MAG: penicillin-binding protein 1C [Flavobacteriales bacterium]